MDSHLNFRDHIQSLLRKANGLIVRHYPILAALTPDNLRVGLTMYKALIRSVITYAAPAWGLRQCPISVNSKLSKTRSLPSKETLRGHSDSSFRGEGYIQCCVGVRLCDMYSNQELAEIHFMYGKADGNAALARRLYQERYPQRQCPDRKTFLRLHYRLCEYGKFNSPGLGRGRPRSTNPEVQEEILETVNMTPSIASE
ncbi:hypothetical protein ANN_20856 [Periplaneta americana]|uniref:DUF4817 domain-containing protein n=1 Tax=Periplaneta americana TaxID=6978 RepID=A0ABQ8SEW3_PERAM|nr:hypothetical protein ANN_20856 [Periplaneta americana]